MARLFSSLLCQTSCAVPRSSNVWTDYGTWCRSSIRRIISTLKSCLIKCTEAKLRKSSIESVATRLYDEAVSSMSVDRQVLGAVVSPGRVSVEPSCFNRTVN